MRIKELNLSKVKYDDIDYLKKYIKENNLDEGYYQKCLVELSKGRPVQYVIGEVNFYGYSIKVNENVLIPRFETELLVEKTIFKIKKLFPFGEIDIIDLGTGSGCIAVTLKKELGVDVFALDISDKALMVARDNAKRNHAEIAFIQGDMDTYQEKRFDVIISNPPYIGDDEEIMEIVKDNEPHLALYAKNNGLDHYEQIIKNLSKIVKDEFLVAFEIGEKQGDMIIDLIKRYLSDVTFSLEKDYHGRDRFIFITNITS